MFRILHMLVVLVIMSLPAFSHAGSLTYRGGEIEYQSGYMDPETFNGKIRDVVFFLNTGEVAYADYLKIKTTPLRNPERLRVDAFEVRNFIFENDEGIIAFADLDWSGLELRGTSPDLGAIINGDNIEDAVLLFGDAALHGLVLEISGEGSISMDRLDIATRQLPFKLLDEMPLQEGSLVLEGLVITPDAADAEFAEELAQLGLQQLEIDARMESTIDNARDRVNSAMDIDISIAGLGSLRLLVDVGFMHTTLQMLDAVLRSPDAASSDQMAALLLTGGLFNKAEVTITDTGFLPLAFDAYGRENGVGRYEAVSEIMDMLAITAGLYAPSSYTLFSPSIRAFLLEGGTLTFTMRPSGPTPFSSFLGFAAAPDTAISLLGTDVRHYP